MGNWLKGPLEWIRTYRLILDTGYQLDLLRTFYVLTIMWNLILLSTLEVSGSSKFGNNCFYLCKSLVGV